MQKFQLTLTAVLTAFLCLAFSPANLLLASTMTPAAVAVSATQLTFSGVATGASPQAQTVSVTGTGNTFTAIPSGGTWLSVTPGSGTIPGAISVSVNTAGLKAGKYSGQVNVTSSDGTSSKVNVVLNLAAPSLIANPVALTFSGAAGSSAQALESIRVTSRPATTYTVTASGIAWLTATPAAGTNATTVTVSANMKGVAAGTYTGAVTIAGNGLTTKIPVKVTVVPAGGPYRIVGWNDLGMHCFDGRDYSVFGVLPPYNTIHAHLIDTSGALVTSPGSYTITYQGVRDPMTGTLTDLAATKSNFWDYSSQLGFGSPAPDEGITGNAMPGLANTPQSMGFSTTDNTWVATGIPEMPYADGGIVNRFPMMRVTARNSSGTVLATTDIVLPTSDEMSCLRCHASNSNPAAKPNAGWVNDPNRARDTKLNILRLHDDRNQSTSLFQAAATKVGYNPAGLEATARSKAILCAQCHGTNALGMNGVTGIAAMTVSMHKRHAAVVDPATGKTMDSSTTRSTCYSCHPGPATKCLRGAMGTLKTSTGAYAMQCQSCHGNLTAVANPARMGWLTEPNCQSCHSGLASSKNTVLAYKSAFSSGTTLRPPVDNTFATNANTPAAGISLYRFSKGHGGLQCEACHGSTHAEFPTSVANDNVQSINLQGHAGMLSECSTCHATIPSTVNGGPHGLHPIGTSWVSRHQDVAERGTASCQGCHGTNYRGTILSRVQANRTMAGKTFTAGTIIGCYSCHNGPQGD